MSHQDDSGIDGAQRRDACRATAHARHDHKQRWSCRLDRFTQPQGSAGGH